MKTKTPPVHYTVKRFNYASSECGAKVLRTNPEAREVSAVVSPSKDRYMLNPCSAPNKYLVIELCEQIGIDTIMIGTFEYFSSLFKDFQVFGSNQFPLARWELIGNFTASNTRDLQKFSLPRPAWYKYLKIKLLTHYGNEFYCPISKVKVYGVTLVEQLKEQFESDSNELKQLQETLKYEEVHIGSLGDDHNLIEKDMLELGSVTDIGDEEESQEDEHNKENDENNTIRDLFNQFITSLETTTSSSTPPLTPSSLNLLFLHSFNNLSSNNNNNNNNNNNRGDDGSAVQRSSESGAEMQGDESQNELPSVFSAGDRKVIVLKSDTVQFNDEDRTNTTIEESQHSKLSVALFSKLADRVKSLEIRQSLLDSHFEKINLKTMEKFDELQRLFVIVHKRIKAQKKLLQHLDEQKELLRQTLHNKIESKTTFLITVISQLEEKFSSQLHHYIVVTAIIFTSILSLFVMIIGCAFYYLTKKRISSHNFRSKIKTESNDKINTSLGIRNGQENKKTKNQTSTKNVNDRNSSETLQKMYSSLSNGQLQQQQERVKKEREKHRMHCCEHQSKGSHGLPVNKSSFF